MSADINSVLDGLVQQERFFRKCQSRALYILKPFKTDKVISFEDIIYNFPPSKLWPSFTASRLRGKGYLSLSM